jgi:hypothetical protein
MFGSGWLARSRLATGLRLTMTAALMTGALTVKALTVEPVPSPAPEPSVAQETVAVLAPGLTIDVKNRQVRMSAKVCLRQGILEFLVCRTHTFEHESIFSTDCKPSQLHTALLVIGLEPFTYDFAFDWSQRARNHPTSQVMIEVEYQLDGTLHRHPMSLFVKNRERADGKIPDHWTFTGSDFYRQDGQEYYAADSTGAVIGVTPKGASVVQIGVPLGIPYQGEEIGTEVAAAFTPLVGTPVQILFTKLNKLDQETDANKEVK